MRRRPRDGAVLVVPVYEAEQAGVFYNTAFVVDADGTYLGKYRKHHIPQVKGFWEKFYFRPGNLGYPVFDTAVGPIGVYICYDRHFPEGWRALGLGGRAHRLQPVSHEPGPVACTSGTWSSPRRPWPTSTSSARSTGWASRTSVTTTSTARRTSSDPRGKLVGERRLGHARTRWSSGTSTCAILDEVRALGLLPRPPARQLPSLTAPSGRKRSMKTLIQRRDGRQRVRTASPRTCSSMASSIAGLGGARVRDVRVVGRRGRPA